MDSLEHTPNPREKQESAHTDERLVAAATFCVRLWEYPGPQQKLRDLDCAADEALAELIRNVIAEGQGRVSEVRGNTLTARFGNCFNALSAAKTLQVKLLTFHRNPAASQVVAAVIVHSHSAQVSSNPSAASPASVLAETNSAQILVGEKIYEAARNIPGFLFGPKAFRAPAPGSEALYELLWTDESTYSHVRKPGQIEGVDATAANRYQLQSELGRSAMGIVYKAYDNVIGRTVALKTISIQRNFGDGVELVDRLKLEAKAAGGLDHPNIITIYDIGQQDGFVYLSMQFVEGETLGSLLEAGKLPVLPTLLSYADQMCSAVGFAHQRGVIHRDLKPANFMVTVEGTVKVLDFGIAKFGDTNMTMTGVVVGTPTYMAPEQATGKKLDQRSDIFSLGTVFYELFTREKPFKGEMPAVLYKLIHEDPVPPSVINPSLPNGIDIIIRKALAKNPADRYQSCEEMREAFREQAALLKPPAEAHAGVEKVAELSAVQARPLSSTRIKAVEPRRRSSSSGWVRVVAVLFLIALAGWAMRVKSRTGAFPSVAGRTITITRTPQKPALGQLEATSAAGDQASTASPQPASTGAEPDNTKTASENSAAQDAASATQPTATSDTAASTAPQTSGDTHSTSTQVAAPDPNPAPASTVQEPASATDTPKTQAAINTPNSGVVVKSEASGEEDTQSEPARPNDTNTARKRWAKAAEPQEVEGFTRKDVLDLLRKADAAAGAGDYPLARYEYGIVLRLDHMNAAARNGLARVRAAREERLGR